MNPSEIGRVVVIGGGTMGNGIAQVFAQAGVPVSLIERTAGDAERAVASVRSNLGRLITKGKLDQADSDEVIARISTATAYDAATASTLVIEAVFEQLELKTEIARRSFRSRPCMQVTPHRSPLLRLPRSRRGRNGWLACISSIPCRL